MRSLDMKYNMKPNTDKACALIDQVLNKKKNATFPCCFYCEFKPSACHVQNKSCPSLREKNKP